MGELGNLHDADAEAISVLEQIRDGSGAGGGNPIVKELGNVEDRISEVRDAIAQLISTVEQSGGMGGGGSVGQAGDLVDAIKRSNLQLADAIQSGIKSGLSSFTSALNNPNSTGVGPLGSPVLKDDPAPAPLDPLTSLLDAAQHAAGPGGSVGSVFQSPLSFAGMSPEAQSALAGVSDTTFTLSQGNPYTNPVLPDLQVPQPGGLSQSAFQSIPIPDLQGGTHPLGVADIGSAGRILDGIQQELDGAVQQLGILMAQPKENAAYISKVKTVIQQLLQAKLALEPYGMAWGGRGLALMAGSAVGMPGNPFTGGDSYQPPAPPTIPMNAILPGIPFNPIGNYGAGSGVTNPSMPITVNALDPSAKGVGDALIQYLRSNGMKV